MYRMFTKSSFASQPVHKSSLELAYKLVTKPTPPSILVLPLRTLARSNQILLLLSLLFIIYVVIVSLDIIICWLAFSPGQ